VKKIFILTITAVLYFTFISNSFAASFGFRGFAMDNKYNNRGKANFGWNDNSWFNDNSFGRWHGNRSSFFWRHHYERFGHYYHHHPNVVPEPFSSVLFLLGGGVLAAGSLCNRKKKTT
jgi:hypothetical protein